MTLRDIGDWFASKLESFMRDVDIALTSNPLDWPLYIIVLMCVFAILGFATCYLVGIYFWDKLQGFLKKHFGENENDDPVTRLGQAAQKAQDVAFMTFVFFAVWAFSGVGLVTFVFSGEGQNETNEWGIWIVILLPLIIASTVVLLALRGRKVSQREKAIVARR